MSNNSETLDKDQLNQVSPSDDESEKITGETQTEEQGLPAEAVDRVSILEEELSKEKDKSLRLFAEFENFKKRNAKDRIELLKYANADVITAMLPVIDDFERASKAGQLPEGVLLIYQKLVNILSQKGLKPMESVGKSFDPDLHDAITQIPVEDENKKNTVVDEIEKGYYLNDKVIRHAKVVVGN